MAISRPTPTIRTIDIAVMPPDDFSPLIAPIISSTSAPTISVSSGRSGISAERCNVSVIALPFPSLRQTRRSCG